MGFHCCPSRSPAASWRTPRQRPLQPNASLACTTVIPGQARELGLMDPEGPGSWTHPDLSRMLYSDGKVITPLYKTRPGDEWVDKNTGEIKQRRYEPDADLHFEGTGETAYGTKLVMVAARSEEIRGRIILDMQWVADKGGEPRSPWAASGAFTPSCRALRVSSTTLPS